VTMADRAEVNVNTKLKTRSGAFFLKNTALLRALRGNRLNASSPFAEVVLGNTNSSDFFTPYSGGSERARISTHGNVGIGTTSPVEDLNVNGSVNIPTGYNLSWGGPYGANIPTLAGVSGTGSDLRFYPAGSTSGETMRITSNGNVGIGTTSPLATLHLSSAGGSSLFLDGTATGTPYISFRQDNTEMSYIEFIDNGASTDYLAIATQGSRNIAIASTGGNVGIGTTSPGVALDIGGVPIAANNSKTIRVAALTGGYYYGAGLEGGFDGSGSGFTRLHTYHSGIDYTILYGNSSGNVGIGTTTPTIYGGGLEVSRSGQAGVRISDTAASGKGVEIGADTLGGFIQTVSAGADFRIFTGNAATQVMYLTSGGNVGIGMTPAASYKLDVSGDVRVSGNINAKYQDVAEWVPASEQLSAGTVVVLDSTKSNQVTSSSVSYDTRVAGVVSEQPGIALGEKSEGKVLVATTGRVRVKVDATKAPIHIGDLLVTSEIPGVAMKSEPVNLSGVPLHRPGTLIGKALEPLEKGTGEILVLLSLQ